MTKAVGHIIPDSLSLQINGYDMTGLNKMLVGICILVPTAPHPTADHTYPDVAFLFTVVTVGLVVVFVVRGRREFSVDFRLFAVLG